MFIVSHVIFYFHGLGRFTIKPAKFYSRIMTLIKLLRKFKIRSDPRGVMINRELKKRYKEFKELKPAVKELSDHNKKKWYGYKNKSNLEK